MAIVSIYPWFEVPEGEVAKFKELFSDFYEKTKTEDGMIHYGFTNCGNKFFCRESYTSADAALAHIGNVDAPLKIAAAHLKSLEFHGPKADMDKLKEPTKGLNPTLWALENGGREVKNYQTGGRPKKDTMVNIVPYFEVPDAEVADFQKNMITFMDLTKNERGCLSYGFTRCGNKFHCRETYQSGDDVLAHLGNVGAPLAIAGKYLKSLMIMGPQAEIDKTKAATEALGTTYWSLDAGAVTRIVPAMAEMKVTTKKGTNFYVKAAAAFLKGVDAVEATENKPAAVALPPVEELRISGLGDATGVAITAAAAAETDGLGRIIKIETQYPDMPNGRGCAQISITIKRV